MCGNMKPAGICMYPCRGAKAYAPKKDLVKGLDLKSGGFFMYPCRGIKAYAPKCPTPRIWV